MNAVEDLEPGGRPERLEIDIQRRELRINGSAVPLGGRAFAVLLALAEAPGATLSNRI